VPYTGAIAALEYSMHFTKVLVLFSATVLVTMLANLSSLDLRVAEAVTTTNDCTVSLQSEIDKTPTGGTLTLKPCIYRSSGQVPRQMSIIGQRGTEIRGSNNWSGNFTYVAGKGYVSSKTVPTMSVSSKTCVADRNCNLPEQVFLDSKPLKQLANGSRPGAGQFALDSSRRVVLGDNPSGKLVEVTVRPAWLYGSYTASNVTISGVVAKHASDTGIYSRTGGSGGWTVKNSDLSYAHRVNIKLALTNNRIESNNIHHGGMIGIGGYKAGLTFNNNHVYSNNAAGFDGDWDAAGVKILRMVSARASGNVVYGNDGHGLWCDSACDNVEFDYNTIHHNKGFGIFQEASAGKTVRLRDNGIYENVGGILIANAGNTDVYNNVAAWNDQGIKVTRTKRSDGAVPNPTGVKIHDNTITSVDEQTLSQNSTRNRKGQAHAWFDWVDGSGLFVSSNVGYNNRYWYTTSEKSGYGRYKCKGNWTHSLPSFNANTCEETGRYLSTSEKDSRLSAKGVPTQPGS
jgi:parallel beta helix pectate lyase-like protein